MAALSAVSSGRTGEAVTYEESVATSAIASLGLRLDCTVRGLGGGLGGWALVRWKLQQGTAQCERKK